MAGELRQLAITSFTGGKDAKREFVKEESKNKTSTASVDDSIDELAELAAQSGELHKTMTLAARIKSKLRPECQWCGSTTGVEVYDLETPTLWLTAYVCNRCGTKCSKCDFVVLTDGNDCCENVKCPNSTKFAS